jgi:hypothetical protein
MSFTAIAGYSHISVPALSALGSHFTAPSSISSYQLGSWGIKIINDEGIGF